MKCITHRDREAVHYCQICKQTICRECSDLLGNVCILCAERECKDEKRSFWITIVGSICLGLAGLWLVLDSRMYSSGIIAIGSAVIMILFFAGIPFGWQALNRITPDIFLILPLAGWGIYFLIKFMLAGCIGWAVAIPKGISMYKRLKVVEEIERNIKIIRGYPIQKMMK